MSSSNSNQQPFSGLNQHEFKSFDEVNKYIRDYEAANCIQTTVTHSRTIQGARNRGYKAYVSSDLQYTELVFRCIHSGSRKSRSTGKRPNQSTYRQQCPFFIRLKAKGDKMVVADHNEEHNHQCNKKTFQRVPLRRALDDATGEKASNKMKLRTNKKLVQNEVSIICHKKMQKEKVFTTVEEHETSETISPEDEMFIVPCTSERLPSSKCPAAISDKCLDDPDTSRSSRNSIENEDENNDEENNIVDKNPLYRKNVPAPSDSSSTMNCDLKRKSYQNSKHENLKNDILLSVKDSFKKPKTKEDRFDAVGRTVAFKLRGLPKQQMLLAEKAIFDILFQAEMKSLSLPKSQQLSNCNGTLPHNFNQQTPTAVCVSYDPTFNSS